ncbi:MAG TPA: hypothetical protein VFO44_10240 [Steroidobacteraceae bacterium]|nr:hypothetical protein [Steroidobacteraceae bacterium]
MRIALASCLLATAVQFAAFPGERAATSVCAEQPPRTSKASSFAPHPGAKRRVYGSPIQRPILKRVKRKKPTSPR